MKLFQRSLNMLAVVTLLAFAIGISSCDDEPMKDPETESPEKGNGEDFIFDEALYFEDNFFGTDSLGNSYDRKLGYALDPGDSKHLYVGADSPEDAKNKFLIWLAPGYETKITSGEDGSIIYSPTDWDGNPQGQITYTPNDDGYQFGTITLSKETPIETFREVTLIRYSGFPDNSELYGDFIVEGDYVGARAWHKNPDQWTCTNLVGLVIRAREPEQDRAGIIVFITSEMNGRNPAIDELAPTLSELYHYIGGDFYNSAVAYLHEPVSYLENLVNELGITMRVDFDTALMKGGFVKMEDNINFSYYNTEFWSRTKGSTKFMGLKTRYVSTLSGKEDWYTIQKPWNPEKRVIFFRYYN